VLARIVVASDNYQKPYFKWKGDRTATDAFIYVIVIGQHVAVVIAVDFFIVTSTVKFTNISDNYFELHTS